MNSWEPSRAGSEEHLEEYVGLWEIVDDDHKSQGCVGSLGCLGHGFQNIWLVVFL
jgi:hypothetical protein